MPITLKVSAPVKDFSNIEITRKIQASAHQIWLAGLGAVSAAQAEGSRTFDSLVKRGQDFEQKTSLSVKKQLRAAEQHAQDIKLKASLSIDKLERALEKQVKRVLTKLGVPSKEDIEQLQRQVEELRTAAPAKKKRLR